MMPPAATRTTSTSPQALRFVDEEGKFSLKPFTYGYAGTLNMNTLRVDYEVDYTTKYPVRLFAHGDAYKLWGLFETGRASVRHR